MADRTPEARGEIVRKRVWMRMLQASPSAGLARYWDAGFQDSVEYAGKLSLVSQRDTEQVMRVRVGGFWTAQRLAQAGLIDRRYREWCPFCRAHVPETVRHMLLECRQWQIQREEKLQEQIEFISALVRRDVPVDQLPELISSCLLGGRSNSFVPEMVLTEPRLPWSMITGGFLRSVVRARMMLLRNHVVPS